jgi:hypothetical protein
MLKDTALTSVAEEIHDIRIVSVGQDSHIWSFLPQKIPGPDSIVSFPRVNGMSPKAMDKDEASSMSVSALEALYG